ncbi:hypothetical protein BCEP27_20698 [Burkholderia cepacia]
MSTNSITDIHNLSVYKWKKLGKESLLNALRLH